MPAKFGHDEVEQMRSIGCMEPAVQVRVSCFEEIRYWLVEVDFRYSNLPSDIIWSSNNKSLQPETKRSNCYVFLHMRRGTRLKSTSILSFLSCCKTAHLVFARREIVVDALSVFVTISYGRHTMRLRRAFSFLATQAQNAAIPSLQGDALYGRCYLIGCISTKGQTYSS